MNRHLANLNRTLLADKKKLGLMVVLVFFGLLLWGRLLLKDVPRTATAEPEDRRSASVDPADKHSQTAPRRNRVEVVWIDPSRRLSRDLFNFNPNRYRRTLIPGDNDNLLTSDNSEAQRADELSGVTEVLDAARRLQLRSVVTGLRPRAVINDRLLAPGDPIDGFELLEIVDRYVLLERSGIVIRLWM